MLRLGVRMRVRAASTAVRTAVDTRVNEFSACPSRLAATDSASLHMAAVRWRRRRYQKQERMKCDPDHTSDSRPQA